MTRAPGPRRRPGGDNPDPTEPAKPESPRIDRRTLLRLGGALSVAVVAGGGVELVLRNLATPASTAHHLSPNTGDVTVLRSLKTVGARPTVTTTTEQPAPSPTTRPAKAVAPPSSVGSGGVAAPTEFFGPSAGRHVYITIDDGYFPDNRVIHLIRSEHVPITTFLIAEAASEHLPFWKSFVSAGGQIQNHTYSHPDLTSLSQGEVEGQWARANQLYKGWFGKAPVIGRPPYGAADHKVAVAAREAGLETMIMWSALDDGSGIQTWNDKKVAPGSIILLHWTPGLYADLVQVLQAVSDNHLVPAFLTKA